jgi:hypothetical protein
MRDNETHPDLALVISKYVHGQGKVACIGCAGNLPPIIREFAILQDRIGWVNFMMGKTSTKLLCIQDSYLRVRGSAQSSEK